MHGEHVVEGKVKQTKSPVTINHSITTINGHKTGILAISGERM